MWMLVKMMKMVDVDGGEDDENGDVDVIEIDSDESDEY